MGQTGDLPFSETLFSSPVICSHSYNLCRPFLALPMLSTKHVPVLNHQLVLYILTVAHQEGSNSCCPGQAASTRELPLAPGDQQQRGEGQPACFPLLLALCWAKSSKAACLLAPAFD